MKRFFSIVLVVALITSLSSCKGVVLVKNSPGKSASAPGQIKMTTGAQSAKSAAPGQVKKTTGSKSAAPYAPGQKKKK